MANSNPFKLYMFDDFTNVGGQFLNASNCCYDYILTNMLDIVDTEPDEKTEYSACWMRRYSTKEKIAQCRNERTIRGSS